MSLKKIVSFCVIGLLVLSAVFATTASNDFEVGGVLIHGSTDSNGVPSDWTVAMNKNDDGVTVGITFKADGFTLPKDVDYTLAIKLDDGTSKDFDLHFSDDGTWLVTNDATVVDYFSNANAVDVVVSGNSFSYSFTINDSDVKDIVTYYNR